MIIARETSITTVTNSCPKLGMRSAVIMLLIINEIVNIGDKEDEDETNELKTTRNRISLAAMLDMQHIQPYASRLFAVNCTVITKYYCTLMKTSIWCKHHYLWLSYMNCHQRSANTRKKYSPHKIDLRQNIFSGYYNFKFPTCKKWKTQRNNIWSYTLHFQGCCKCYNINKLRTFCDYKFTSHDAALNSINYRSFLFNIQSFPNIQMLRKAGSRKHQRALELHQFHRYQKLERNKKEHICSLVKSELDRQCSAHNSKEGPLLLSLIKTRNIQGKCNCLTQNVTTALFSETPMGTDVNINCTQYTKKKICYKTRKNNKQKHIPIEHPIPAVLWNSSNYLLRSKSFMGSKPIHGRKLLSVTQSSQNILNAYPIFYLNKNMNNRQSEKQYNTNLLPEKCYISQESTSKGRKHGKRNFLKIKSNQEVEDAISSRKSKDQLHVQVGKPIQLLQIERSKRGIKTPSRYSRRRNRKHLKGSSAQRKFARHKRDYLYHSHKGPFRNSPSININYNSDLLYPEQNITYKYQNSNSKLVNTTQIKHHLLAALWLIRKNKLASMDSNPLNKGTNLGSINLEDSAPIINATFLKGFSKIPAPLLPEDESSIQLSTVPKPLVIQKQSSTQSPTTPESLSNEEQSSVERSTVPKPLVTQHQSPTQASTTPESLSNEEQSSVERSTVPKPLVTQHQSPTQASTTPESLSNEEQSSVELSKSPKPLVTQNQSSTQSSTTPKSLSNEEQSSMQLSTIPKPLVTQHQSSTQSLTTPESQSNVKQSSMQHSKSPKPLVTQNQSPTQASITPESQSNEEQSSMQHSKSSEPLVTQNQSSTKSSTTPKSLSEEQKPMQLSIVSIPLATEEQFSTHPPTTPKSLSNEEQNSVQLATVPKPLVTLNQSSTKSSTTPKSLSEEQNSTQLSIVSIPLATEEQFSTQPSTTTKSLPSEDQSSVQRSIVSIPLLTEKQSSPQTNGLTGHFEEQMKIISGPAVAPTTENKETSQMALIIKTHEMNNTNNTQNQTSKQILHLFQKFLDEENKQLKFEVKELEERIEKILMANIKSAHNSSTLNISETEPPTSLMAQSTTEKPQSIGEEKALNINLDQQNEIALQEPAYDQESFPEYDKPPNKTDLEQLYEALADDANFNAEISETATTNTDSETSTTSYSTVSATMITPSLEICSPNETNCICSMDKVVDDFIKFLLNPSFFLKNVEDYNCSTWIRPPAEILLSDDEQPIVKKKWKREAVVLMHSTEFFNLAKLEDMMHSPDKLTITDKHMYTAPGSTVQMSCINIEEKIDLPSEYNFKWARSDGVLLSEKNKQNIEDGVMTIKNVSIKDAGNYSCTVNFSNPVFGEASEHVFMHELSLVLVPKFFLRGYAHYYAPSGCTKEDKHAFQMLFPNKVKQLLCGLSELCDVDIMHPKCHTPEKGKETAEIIVIFLVHVNSITALIAGLDDDICDIMCRRKVELKFSMLLSSNVHTVFQIPVSYRSTAQNASYASVPNSIKFTILVGCSAGYFIQDDVCFPCPVGYYSIGDSASCMRCAAGTYQPEPGSSLCIPCPNPFAAATCTADIDAWHNRSGTTILYIVCIVAMVIIIICCCCFCCWLYYRSKRKKSTSGSNTKLEEQTSAEVSDSETLSPHSEDGLLHGVSRKQLLIASEYEIPNEAKSYTTELSNQKDRRSTRTTWSLLKTASRKSAQNFGENEPLIAKHAPGDSKSKEQQPLNVTPTHVITDLFYSELRHKLHNLKRGSVLGSLYGLQPNGTKTSTIKGDMGVPIDDPVAVLHLKGSLVDKAIPEDTLNKHGERYAKVLDRVKDNRSHSRKCDENNKIMKNSNVNWNTKGYSTVNLNHSKSLVKDSSKSISEPRISDQPYEREYVPELPPADF